MIRDTDTVGGDLSLSVSQNADEFVLAARYAPILRFDAREPFLPVSAGYTIFCETGESPSFRQGRKIDLTPPDGPRAEFAIEYAIWWDWDIGHLYELEHAWVYLDAQLNPVWVEASSHGAYASMILENGSIPLEGAHPQLYSQPGKHAFSPTPHWFEMFRDMVFAETSAHAGRGGVLVKREYARQVAKTPAADRRVSAWLREKAFTPTLQFTQSLHIPPEMLVPWPVLDTWIPRRVNWWLEQLKD